MAIASETGFIQANSYPAEPTRRNIYSPSFPRNSSGNIGSVSGGILGIGSDFAMTAPVSGMSVNNATGEAVVPGTSSTTQSGYYIRGSSTTNTSVAAADPSNPRIDLVCLSINDAFYTGSSNNGVIQVVTGTPTSGATLTNLTGAPALPTSSLLLGYVLVPAGATNIITADLSFRASYLSLGPNTFNATPTTTSGTASNGQHVIVSANSPTITLPVPFKNARVKVTNYGTGTAVISHNASEVIYGPGQGASGASTMNVGPYGTSRTLESDGTSWYETGASSGAVGAVAGSIGSNVTLTNNSIVKVFDTASLGVGTWLVTMGITVSSGDGAAIDQFEIRGIADSATATFAGQNSCQNNVAISGKVSFTLTFVATVTVAGTLQMLFTNNASFSGLALAATAASGYANATGYTAVQLS